MNGRVSAIPTSSNIDFNITLVSLVFTENLVLIKDVYPYIVCLVIYMKVTK